MSSFFFAEAEAEAFADAEADGAGIAEGNPDALADAETAADAEPDAAGIAEGNPVAETLAEAGMALGIAELAAGLPDDEAEFAPEPLGGGSHATTARAKGTKRETRNERMKDLTDRLRRTSRALRG